MTHSTSFSMPAETGQAVVPLNFMCGCSVLEVGAGCCRHWAWARIRPWLPGSRTSPWLSLPTPSGGPRLLVGACSCSWRAESTGTSSHLSSPGSGLSKWGQAGLAGLSVRPGPTAPWGWGAWRNPFFPGEIRLWQLLEGGLGIKARRGKGSWGGEVDPSVARGHGNKEKDQ